MKRMRTILSACAIAALLLLCFAVALADSAMGQGTAPQQETAAGLQPPEGGTGAKPQSPAESGGQLPQIPNEGDRSDPPATPEEEPAPDQPADRLEANSPKAKRERRASNGEADADPSDAEEQVPKAKRERRASDKAGKPSGKRPKSSGTPEDQGGQAQSRRGGKSAQTAPQIDFAVLAERGVISPETCEAIQSYLETSASSGEHSEPEALLDELFGEELITEAEREAILAAIA